MIGDTYEKRQQHQRRGTEELSRAVDAEKPDECGRKQIEDKGDKDERVEGKDDIC